MFASNIFDQGIVDFIALLLIITGSVCRPVDLPSENTPFTHTSGTGSRRLASASSAAPVNKLSPRVRGHGGSLKSKSAAPQLPQSVPGSSHATKPLLVVHKTGNSFANSSIDRKGYNSVTTSSRTGSLRSSEFTLELSVIILYYRKDRYCCKNFHRQHKYGMCDNRSYLIFRIDSLKFLRLENSFV